MIAENLANALSNANEVHQTFEGAANSISDPDSGDMLVSGGLMYEFSSRPGEFITTQTMRLE